MVLFFCSHHLARCCRRACVSDRFSSSRKWKDQRNRKRLPAGFVHQCKQFLFRSVPDAGRKHFLYRADPGEKPADLESGFSENKHQKTPHFPSKDTPYTIPAGPVRAPAQSAARIPATAILQCHKGFLPNSGKPYFFLLFQTFQMKRVLLRRISCHLLLQGRHHRPPFSSGYTGCIAGQGCCTAFR